MSRRAPSPAFPTVSAVAIGVLLLVVVLLVPFAYREATRQWIWYRARYNPECYWSPHAQLILSMSLAAWTAPAGKRTYNLCMWSSISAR